jgi:DNA-binding CsgD family transcriptional regulator
MMLLLGLAVYLVASRLPRRLSVPAVLVAAGALSAALLYAASVRTGVSVAVEAVEGLLPLAAAWFIGDEALRAGASGFALKSRPLEELLSAIRIVAEGEALLAPSVTRRLIAHFSRAGQAPADSGRDFTLLTDREREVLSLVARGLSNAELADALHVSLPTVKTHVSRILTKLDARDRTQLVVFAYEAGLVPAL